MHPPGDFSIPGIPNVQSIENAFTASLNQNFGRNHEASSQAFRLDSAMERILRVRFNQERMKICRHSMSRRAEGVHMKNKITKLLCKAPPSWPSIAVRYNPESEIFMKGFQDSYDQYPAQKLSSLGSSMRRRGAEGVGKERKGAEEQAMVVRCRIR